ncbi:hypothetical protein [Leptospira noguchii]|uniref:hypothetical protein n=1 Tax=Leptospira noguchii TaxID=28182 RepID=UPI0003285CC7|nr:hypothetical protein [Leptospira noguchii]EMS88292.1 hypothetical protein LEP1GSC073_4343 [Leptospira noguchii str. Cascata]
MIPFAIPKDVANSGFKRIEKTSKKMNIIKPKKKLTSIQKAKNTRIFVENAFAGIKRFRITSFDVLEKILKISFLF